MNGLFKDRVITELREMPNLRFATSYLVADSLHMANNTLIRKLRREGSPTFHALVMAERKRRSDDLVESGRKIDRHMLAKRMGYLEPNSAYRAFKQFYGMSVRDHNRCNRT